MHCLWCRVPSITVSLFSEQIRKKATVVDVGRRRRFAPTASTAAQSQHPTPVSRAQSFARRYKLHSYIVLSSTLIQGAANCAGCSLHSMTRSSSFPPRSTASIPVRTATRTSSSTTPFHRCHTNALQMWPKNRGLRNGSRPCEGTERRQTSHLLPAVEGRTRLRHHSAGTPGALGSARREESRALDTKLVKKFLRHTASLSQRVIRSV